MSSWGSVRPPSRFRVRSDFAASLADSSIPSYTVRGMSWTLFKAPSVPIKGCSLSGLFRSLHLFQRSSQSSDSKRSSSTPHPGKKINSSSKPGKISFPLTLTYHHVSSALQASGIKPDTCFTAGVEVIFDEVQSTSRKGRHSCQHEDSIQLNLVCQEAHGVVRLKTLMSFRDWCTIIKLLNEQLVGDIPNGT
jgi:hypothetical protein